MLEMLDIDQMACSLGKKLRARKRRGDLGSAGGVKYYAAHRG